MPKKTKTKGIFARLAEKLFGKKEAPKKTAPMKGSAPTKATGKKKPVAKKGKTAKKK